MVTFAHKGNADQSLNNLVMIKLFDTMSMFLLKSFYTQVLIFFRPDPGFYDLILGLKIKGISSSIKKDGIGFNIVFSG